MVTDLKSGHIYSNIFATGHFHRNFLEAFHTDLGATLFFYYFIH